MKLSPTLKEKLIERAVYTVVGGILTAFGFLIVSVWKEIKPQLLAHVLPAMSNVTLLVLCGLLFIVNCVLLLWLAFLLMGNKAAKKAVKEKEQFVYDPATGIYMNRKEGEPQACGKCWPEINYLRLREHGWDCMKCHTFFSDPKRKKAPRPSRPRSNWLSPSDM